MVQTDGRTIPRANIDVQQSHAHQSLPSIELLPIMHKDYIPNSEESREFAHSIDLGSRLSENATSTALDNDINTADRLKSVRSGETTSQREEDPLLQPSLASRSHVTPIAVPRVRYSPISALSTFRTWWIEWVFVLIAIGILIAIVVTLRLNNQQPQPKWGLGVNLNTVIAVLATLLRSCLVTVVEEVISQAKWYWQYGGHPARHLDYFDAASRGPIGALLLCFKVPALLKGKPLISRYSSSAVIACSITVLSLAIGAFTQQAVRSVPCRRPVKGVNASIPVASYAHPFTNELDFNWSTWDLDTSTKARIVGAFGGQNVTRPQFLEGCTSGNCTFESLNDVTHITSGFCSRCVETTNELVGEANYPSYFEGVNYPIKQVVRLPSNPSLMLAFGLDHATRRGLTVNSNSTSLEALSDSLHSNLTAAINVASITRAPCSSGSKCSGLWTQTWDGKGSTNWSDFNVVSASCGLYPCARHMKAEASNGRFTETILREEFYTMDTALFERNQKLAPTKHSFLSPCWENNTRFDKPPNDDPVLVDLDSHVMRLPPCAYGVSSAFFYQVQKFVSSFANGNCSAFLDIPLDKVTCRSGSASLGDSFCHSNSENPLCQIDLWWLQNLYNSGNATFETISAVMDNLALAITDSARAQPYPILRYVPGTIWESTICTEFNWPTICFPAALIALTAIALTFIMSATTHSEDEPPIWKSSILPLIYGRVAGPESNGYENTVNEMDNSAKKDMLVLKRGQGQWEFKLTKRDDEDKLGGSQGLVR